MYRFKIPAIIGFLIISFHSFSQKKQVQVIGYYAGTPQRLDSFPIEKLDIIIFSFGHLKGDSLHLYSARDTATLQRMVALKTRNPALKVMISLGGWGGCASCSDVFSSAKSRKNFALSVRKMMNDFRADGIDMDWEYPVIEGYPGHKYQQEDKENFTKLIVQLRKKLGRKKEISFASGGFSSYIQNSIEWKKVMKKVDRVNVMSYDLVSGYAKETGHHTALYSTPQQKESTDNAVNEMLALGVPANKIAIGAAFYAKVWQDVPDTSLGMYQTGTYKTGVPFSQFEQRMSPDSGFVYYWDSLASAPFIYNRQQKLFATFDDKKSIELKTKYAISKGLNGVMFWQLGEDRFTDGLLDEIDKVKKEEE